MWKAQGTFRYIGITTVDGLGHDVLIRALTSEPFDFAQFSYNIGQRKAEKRLLPLVQDKGIATLINRPYQEGALFQKVKNTPLPAWVEEFDCKSWAQFFLKFIVSHPGVTCAIPATGNPRHLVDNMGAGVGRLPDETTRRRMVRYFESL